ncbi:MAG: nitroreductase family protein [Muribaculaceae bacterium]|nr:nitroreductase family protein [Muribaculaceae bacterium]
MNNYFSTRNTIREYSDAKVPKDLIDKIIRDAAQAPTTGNMQLYSVIITESRENKDLLAPLHFNQPACKNASLLLTFCADFNRFEKWCKFNNAIPGYRNFQSFISAILDVTIFAQQFNTIAELNGLGCCYLGTTTYNAPEIASLLKLPELVIPVITIAIGYPKNSVQEPTERLSIEAFVHNEFYKDYSKETIDRLYKEKENNPTNRKFVKENNKQTLAQVFTDIRYTKENNEIFSKLYFDFINKNGFNFPK